MSAVVFARRPAVNDEERYEVAIVPAVDDIFELATVFSGVCTGLGRDSYSVLRDHQVLTVVIKGTTRQYISAWFVVSESRTRAKFVELAGVCCQDKWGGTGDTTRDGIGICFLCVPRSSSRLYLPGEGGVKIETLLGRSGNNNPVRGKENGSSKRGVGIRRSLSGMPAVKWLRQRGETFLTGQEPDHPLLHFLRPIGNMLPGCARYHLAHR